MTTDLELGPEFLDVTVVSAAQQEFGVASTKQAIGYDFNGGKGFSIPGLSVHGHNNAPAPAGVHVGVKNDGSPPSRKQPYPAA